ncbi:hypothetical protein ACFFX0_24055 [Citricoccus parietis]|uniref:Uncharacterized protein n=1 Tax=Citricoccus parietis TaxID=592307 RepID=A0ABV5G581_9MICC
MAGCPGRSASSTTWRTARPCHSMTRRTLSQVCSAMSSGMSSCPSMTSRPHRSR